MDFAKKSAPKYSMRPRPERKDELKEWVPGPGAYGAVDDKRGLGPKYSITGRSAPPPSSRDATPGPAAYPGADPGKFKGKNPPAYSMASGHKALYDSIGTGLRCSAHLLHIALERVSGRVTFGCCDLLFCAALQNPGPGSYTLKDPMIHPQTAASMKGRTHIPESRDSAPGPGAYTLKTMFSTEAPKVTMAGRTQPPPSSRDSTPGPAAYSLKSTVGQAPKASISGRHDMSKSSEFAPGL